MKALSRELASQYDINIKKYQYIRSNYYLDTNQGKFILRKVDIPKEQILFNYEVDLHLRQHLFRDINHIYLTKKNIPYAVVGDQYYIMQEYVNCDETDFKSIEDLKQTIMVLAKFHKAAKNIKSAVKDIERVNIRNIYDHYYKRMVQNEKLKKSIIKIKQKSNFEFMFLEEIDNYRYLEEMALDSINHELAEQLIENVKMSKSIAHKNYTYHTVNKTDNGLYIMSQIDTCGYDIQINDLSQILCKIMQKNNWDSNLLYTLISTYVQINNLSSDEMQMLKFMMIYPEKYNNICFKYSSSKRRWNYSMFEQKWANMLIYKEYQIETAKIIKSW